MKEPIHHSTFPSELQPLWESLQQEVMGLHAVWKIYRQLFGCSRERIDFLNQHIPTLSYILQRTILLDVQLALSKLSDPAKTGKFHNATLGRLVSAVSSSLDDESKASELKAKLGTIQDSCEQIRQRRNKQLAHPDLEQFLAQFGHGKAELLPGPSRQEIETALQNIGALMNQIELHFTDTSTLYDKVSLEDDGNCLISKLKQAARYSSLVQARRIPIDDLKHLPHFDV